MEVSFDGTWEPFTFGLVRGNDGTPRINGTDGAPGEVTNAQLSSAVSDSSNNSNAVSTLNQGADSNYSQPQMQAQMDKMDELITALRRRGVSHFASSLS